MVANQKGAALIVVLSLLTISLMVGLSSMQSSQIDERLAGNYKAQSVAQMGAEEAASAGWGGIIDGIESDDWTNLFDLTDHGLGSLTWADLKDGESGACESPATCFYRYIKDGGDRYIVAMGSVGDGAVSVSELVIVEVIAGYRGPAFEDFDPLTILGEVDSYGHTNSRPFTMSRRTHADEEEPNIGYSVAVQNYSDLDEITFFHTNEGNHAGVVDEEGNKQLVNSKGYDSDALFEVAALVGFAKSSSGDNVKYYNGACALKDDEEDEDGLPPCYEEGEETSGLLVVDGDFSWNGSNQFEGLIIVTGQNITYNGGGSGSLVGAMVHLPSPSGGFSDSDTFVLGDSSVNMNGGGASAFIHDRKVLNALQESLFGSGGGSEAGASPDFYIQSWE